MLIGVDASRAAASQRTGTENYSLYLIRALLDLDADHRWRLYFNWAPAADLFRRDERVEWRVLPFPRLWTHVRLAWELLRHPPDVLFVPAHVLPLVHVGRGVVTVHDLGYRHYPRAHTLWSRWYLDWSTRHNVRAACHVIADSRATKSDLMAHYHVRPEKVSVIYPGGGDGFAPVRDAAALAAVRQRYGTGERYYLYLGSLHPRKNVPALLVAYATLRRAGLLPDDVRLVVAGRRGWRYEELVRLAGALGLHQHAVFTGYVPAHDLPALLSGALAYVLPSWYEGFGLPVLEAMACDTPVICSNVSALPEVVGDAALLFPPDDAAALAAAMERVYRDPALRQELVARGRERVRAFSWKLCAQQVLAVLESVAA